MLRNSFIILACLCVGCIEAPAGSTTPITGPDSGESDMSEASPDQGETVEDASTPTDMAEAEDMAIAPDASIDMDEAVEIQRIPIERVWMPMGQGSSLTAQPAAFVNATKIAYGFDYVFQPASEGMSPESIALIVTTNLLENATDDLVQSPLPAFVHQDRTWEDFGFTANAAVGTGDDLVTDSDCPFWNFARPVRLYDAAYDIVSALEPQQDLITCATTSTAPTILAREGSVSGPGRRVAFGPQEIRPLKIEGWNLLDRSIRWLVPSLPGFRDRDESIEIVYPQDSDFLANALAIRMRHHNLNSRLTEAGNGPLFDNEDFLIALPRHGLAPAEFTRPTIWLVEGPSDLLALTGQDSMSDTSSEFVAASSTPVSLPSEPRAFQIVKGEPNWFGLMQLPDGAEPILRTDDGLNVMFLYQTTSNEPLFVVVPFGENLLGQADPRLFHLIDLAAAHLMTLR